MPKSLYAIGSIGESKSKNDIDISGADISIPAGNYEEDINISVNKTELSDIDISIDNNIVTASINQSEGYINSSAKIATGVVTAVEQATPSISINGNKITASSTQQAGYISGGTKVTTSNIGIVEQATPSISINGNKITASSTQQAGYVLEGMKSSTEYIPSIQQATSTISVDANGKITASSTQQAGYVASGTTHATHQLPILTAQNIIPSTHNKTINAGQYLTGVQTIIGDANLVASNIAKGKTIFGVTGSYVGNMYPTGSGTLVLYDCSYGEAGLMGANTMIGVTGGWQIKELPLTGSLQGEIPTYSYNADGFIMTLPISKDTASCAWYPINKIDLTNYSTLNAIFGAGTIANHPCRICVLSNIGTVLTGTMIAEVGLTNGEKFHQAIPEGQKFSINIQNLYGDYYIAFIPYGTLYDSRYTTYVVRKVWLE